MTGGDRVSRDLLDGEGSAPAADARGAERDPGRRADAPQRGDRPAGAAAARSRARGPRVHVPLVRQRGLDRAAHRGLPRAGRARGGPGARGRADGRRRPGGRGGAGAVRVRRVGAGRTGAGAARGDRPGGRAGAGVRPRGPPAGIRRRLLRHVPAAAAAGLRRSWRSASPSSSSTPCRSARPTGPWAWWSPTGEVVRPSADDPLL